MNQKLLQCLKQNEIWKAFESGKTIQYFGNFARWTDIEDLNGQLLLDYPNSYRVKTLEFPAPPIGKSWHNPANVSADVVEVDKGHRLLLSGEIIPEDYEYYAVDKDSWIFEPDHSGKQVGSYNQYTTMRTKTPIQNFVPLEAMDIVFGSILRHKNWERGSWVAVIKVSFNGVAIAKNRKDNTIVAETVGWNELQGGYQIKMPDDKDWRDCHKIS